MVVTSRAHILELTRLMIPPLGIHALKQKALNFVGGV